MSKSYRHGQILKLIRSSQISTQEELQQIMNAEEGLLYLKGQWIEVDRERLSEALAHWKKIEEAPNVPHDKAPVPLEIKGPSLHKYGEPGMR